jgi:hypothetical protein
MTPEALRATLAPLLDALGATAVAPHEAGEADIVLQWESEPILAVRLDYAATAASQVRSVEREMGASLSDLDRAGKQAVVRILDERGAFAVRRAIEDIADAMGVSRITIYNYLNAIREPV